MVNAGPLAIAKVFLGHWEEYPAEHVLKLRALLKDFSKVRTDVKKANNTSRGI